MKKLTSFLAASALAVSSMVANAGGATKAETKVGGGTVTGNIGIFSQYILRGGVESDKAVLQGGLDWEKGNFYLGYWGSSLPDTNVYPSGSFEHNIYGGYKGKIGGMAFDVGLIQYLYMKNSSATNATDLKARLEVGPVTLGLNYALADATWTNKGDIWWSIAASKKLKGFTLSGTAVFYTYETNGRYLTSTEDSGFSNLDITLSHPIGKTGADWNLTYVVAGDDRNGNERDDQVVFAITYSF